MHFIAIDLGTTNIKVGAYDDKLTNLGYASKRVEYIEHGVFVEFDADDYVHSVVELIGELTATFPILQKDTAQIVLTGQAESLVLLNKKNESLMNAISWMDERSYKESQEMRSLFSEKEWYQKTGQQAILPTWPSTKIAWLKKHKPDVFALVDTYMLLKDFVAFRLSNVKAADMSIATFSCYFDIFNKTYWKKMLQYLEIKESQLPPLVEPGTILGPMEASFQKMAHFTQSPTINVGTLDHFAGMIGCGNITEGSVSYSTGTVMALATFANTSYMREGTVALHYGFFPDTYIMLPVAESGGASLQWFKDFFLPEVSFKEIDQEIVRRGSFSEVLFLPYLIGTNAPEFDPEATSMFWNIRSKHDAYDFAYAVMEGVAFLLKKNIDEIESNHIKVEKILATGGGATSPLWCQLQADITQIPVVVPKDAEAACLGAAIMGAVSYSEEKSYLIKGVNDIVEHVYTPKKDSRLKKKEKQFALLYEASLKAHTL
ncbi:MAG: FGGY-family carbohydrate kinase [Sphaerochaetaceae bacterium]